MSIVNYETLSVTNPSVSVSHPCCSTNSERERYSIIHAKNILKNIPIVLNSFSFHINIKCSAKKILVKSDGVFSDGHYNDIIRLPNLVTEIECQSICLSSDNPAVFITDRCVAF